MKEITDDAKRESLAEFNRVMGPLARYDFPRWLEKHLWCHECRKNWELDEGETAPLSFSLSMCPECFLSKNTQVNIDGVDYVVVFYGGSPAVEVIYGPKTYKVLGKVYNDHDGCTSNRVSTRRKGTFLDAMKLELGLATSEELHLN